MNEHVSAEIDSRVTRDTESPHFDEMRRRALEMLERVYGYSAFRPGQWEVVRSVLQGRDSVVLMPTGGGKSICFQMAALLMEGCCIVVSPLIALMNDQVAALQANGVAAATINSFNYESDNRRMYTLAAEGRLKLLYMSPERLLADIDVIRRLVKVSFVAVDEAHCISQWGHDFRPVYTSLVKIKEAWPDIPVMALTATADRLTREDIARALSLREPYMHIGSFDRPNLSLRVIQGSTAAQRVAVISGLIERYGMDCGIVYCLSRKKTEAMARKLSEAGFRVGCYHAGMEAAERERVQREFVEGRYQAICATVAFGMGIDKSNIRWVVHNNIPGNIESYYQEIGRAGRDGMPAETILFYSYADIMTRMNFVDESGQQEINRSKLTFMQRYAEADVCRRRILLSYFSEEMTCDCGNCDNCRSPRQRFDGSVLVQKALSAVIRTRSAEPAGRIIEILRGSRNQYILSKGYDRLPTFGVGSDLSSPEWHAYILQMIQLGMLEVAYEENFHLRATPLGMKVLRGEQQGVLARHVAPAYAAAPYRAQKRKEPAVEAEQLSPDEALLRDLKELRVTLAAQRKGMADYMILSDVTIARIVEQKPMDVAALARIEGMGMARLAEYYAQVLALVCKCVTGSRRIPRRQSDLLSRTMYEHGMSVHEIAAMRRLRPGTVLSHLLGYAADGFEFDCGTVLSPLRFIAVECMVEDYQRLLQDMPLPQPEVGAGEDPSASEDNATRFARLAEMRTRLQTEYGVTDEEYGFYRSIERLYTVEDGRYVMKPAEVSEPVTSYGAAPEEDVDSYPYDSVFDPHDPDDGLF
ncbi:MAG: DNA helicase RecQ [Muribaculaceae bacterium]|nr:DNA helicase RecQ [Muribaculaceae bacterium]